MLCIQVAEYLLDHQGVFDARYNLNRTTALLTRFNVDVKNPFKSLGPGHRLVFLCTCFFLPCRKACLALFRKDGVIVTRCRLFGGGPPRTNTL